MAFLRAVQSPVYPAELRALILMGGSIGMAGISLRHIDKIYENRVTAVSDLNLEIRDHEFMVLVGPSGCGKSTTLRMIAGLEEISGGELYIGDRLVNHVAPRDRDIAMVFQNYALYPHMTVYKNMAFGLRLRRTDKQVIDRKIRDAAKVLGIEEYLDRKPKALSGGQRQRVALGRAMVRDPSVFLLDEPLSNLDAKLRTSMRSEISKLHSRLGTTFVYVTHDQTEAMTMGDRICVMKDGLIQQVDTPQRLYDAPCNLFVAGFIGSPQMNFIPVKIGRTADGYDAGANGVKIPIPPSKAEKGRLDAYIGKEAVLGIRPEHLCDPQGSGSSNTCRIRVRTELCELMGSEINLYAAFGEEKLVARLPARVPARAGEELELGIDCEKLHLFDSETGHAIFH